MVLPGLRAAITLGWALGIILLKNVWGPPVFTWCCFPILLWFVYGPIFIYFNVDILYHWEAQLNVYGIADSRVDRTVVGFLMLQLFFSNLLIRLIFFWKARKFADLLARLQRYSRAKSPTGSCRIKVNMNLFLTGTVFLTTFLIAVLEGGIDMIVYGNDIYWIYQILGHVASGIIFTVGYLLPMMIPGQVAFTIIVKLTEYLSEIFEDYCKHVEETVGEGRLMGRSIVVPLSKQAYDDDGEGAEDEKYYYEATPKMTMAAYLGAGKKRMFFTDHMRRELISRFEVIREVFDLVHEVISPMALVLLATASIDVVMEGYEIILLSTDSIHKLKDALHLINYTCFFWILECGQRLTDKIEKWKSKFEDKLVQLSEDAHHLERQTVKDVLSVLKFWDWKFTAMDFFVIDRKLGSGVVSLIMTYVVVLVQLKVSDNPDVIGLVEVVNKTEDVTE